MICNNNFMTLLILSQGVPTLKTGRIASEIDCRKCANCCRKIQPILSQKDIRDFSRGLGLAVNKFKEQYLVKDDETPSIFRFNALPCPFLRGNLCTNYEHRPQDCRSFPHLHKQNFTFRLWIEIDPVL